MNKEQVKQIKRFENIIHLVDAIFLVIYVGLFIFLFSKITVPDLPPEVFTNFEYTIFGMDIDTFTLNTWMSYLAIFIIVTFPLTFINFKKTKFREFYEYSRYVSSNYFVNAIVSLLAFNPVSFVLKIIASRRILLQSEGYGFKEASKRIWAGFKNLFKKKVKVVEEEDSDLKKAIRRQTAFTFMRMFFSYLFLSIVALLIFVPFYWMILTALKTYYESNLTMTPRFFISLSEMQWMNFKYVLQEVDFSIYIKNTLYVGILSTVGTIITTVLAAFAFARLEFKGRETIFSVLLMTMMIPGELYILTNFLTVSQAGLGWVGGAEGTNSYFLAMIIPFMTSVFYIFFLRQTFKQIPETLYKAAKVDGSSDFKYLTRVMIPIAGPTIFTITILSVIGSWNAFIWPRLITSVGDVNEGRMYWLISVALRDADFTTAGTNPRVMFNMQIAASAIVTIPLIVVFLLLRKYIMSGVGRSGTKG
ncbi:MAG TPA: carbohydrate ABC transporter permease [Acholeplasmataceae bacterium]|jgi:ABC-type glycerol-3-phosphate transport system permease component|nr:carbohydrate ABC transporter permease [Acholeplasmataceae bacterium]HRX44989.1 carbohydrate ABC transporter permease [Acholeplasmataceae bacterium]